MRFRRPHRALTAALLVSGALLAACGDDALPPPPTPPPTASNVAVATATAAASATPTAPLCFTPQTGPDRFADTVTLTTAADGLQSGDYRAGCGAPIKSGDKVTVQYTGWLTSGTMFDSSRTRGQPASFSLGGVIPGWTEGLVGMKVGAKRRLVIPPALGYGAAGQPPTIPGNSTLVFDIELISIG